MNRKELINKYIKFFESKGHKRIENKSLIPQNDPTVLFTTAGMHPLVPFLLGQKHPSGKKLVNVQRCIRTGDIDSVGDETHHTFFEMLGNWSLGDAEAPRASDTSKSSGLQGYWKKEAINFSFEFLTKILKINKEKLAISCFNGDENISKDEESAEIWISLGVAKNRILFLGKEANWWGPAGKTGPCGPDTEMFYWKSKDKKAPQKFDSEDKNWVEIWNDVLMEYEKDENGNYKKAKQKNIDTGMGVERTLTVLNGLEDNYLSDAFLPLIKKIENLSGKKYSENKREIRIIADHIKASVFIINDGINPSNSEQGYVLRRLIRRAIRYGKKLGMTNFCSKIAKDVFVIYDEYSFNVSNIINTIKEEEEKFLLTLEKGIKIFDKISNKNITGKEAFLLYQSYGFPIEMTIEFAKEKEISVDEKGFYEESSRHSELSRTASKGRFSSGLADNSDKTTKLHTATHLLHSALRKVLGDNVKQKGSNITPERLRFDFSFDRKITEEEKNKIEYLVNEAIKNKLEIVKEEMSPKEAKNFGALGFFEHKYGDKITVYTVGKGKTQFSKEICTGPHVKNTIELGKFKIIKEESSSSGVRRIKAILE